MTLKQGLMIMRRMMHSLFLIVCFGVPVFAQQTTSSLIYSNHPTTQVDLGNSIDVHSQGSAVSTTVGGGQSHHSMNPSACNGPYSPLGAKMACSDASPNLWNCYPSERAALAAKIMQHVDGQCGCCVTSSRSRCSQLHASPCDPGCGATLGCASKPVINRYRESFSTLYADPCVECSTGKCRRIHRPLGMHAPVGCGCTSCGVNAAPAYGNQYPSTPCASCASIPTASPGAIATRTMVAPNGIPLTR